MALIAGDLATFFVSLAVAVWLRGALGEGHVGFTDHLPAFVSIFALWLLTFWLLGMYELSAGRNALALARSLGTSIAAAAAIAIAFFYLTPGISIAPKTTLFLDIAVTAALLAVWRYGYSLFLRGSKLRNRIVFVGLSDEARELVGELQHRPELGLDVVAAVVLDGSDAPGIPVRRTIEGFADFLESERIGTVVFSISPRGNHDLARELYDSIFLKVNFVDVVNFYEQITRRVPVSAISRTWFLENLQESRKRLYELAKRAVDLAGSVAVGTVTLAVMPFVAIAIYATDRGPIFFVQDRLGRGGKSFRLRKFRTMVTDAEKDGARFAEPNDSRVTQVGRFLRATRIDELPQCLNVLMGEMSFIGPRPERPEFSKAITEDMPYYPMRLLIRPGLTGWAQVNHSYYATAEEHRLKLQYDLYYVKNRSFALDLAIAARTLGTILRAKGM